MYESDTELAVQQKFKQALTQGLLDLTPRQRNELARELQAAGVSSGAIGQMSEEEMEDQVEAWMDVVPIPPTAKESLLKNQIPKSELPTWAVEILQQEATI